eukprot:jgi/Botrbrau1/6021/Bobra.0042s0007.1
MVAMGSRTCVAIFISIFLECSIVRASQEASLPSNVGTSAAAEGVCGQLGVDPTCSNCNSQCFAGPGQEAGCTGTTVPNCAYRPGPCCVDVTLPNACPLSSLVCLSAGPFSPPPPFRIPPPPPISRPPPPPSCFDPFSCPGTTVPNCAYAGVTCCWNLILPNACPLSGSVCLSVGPFSPPPPFRIPPPPPISRPPPPPTVPSPPPPPKKQPPPPPTPTTCFDPFSCPGTTVPNCAYAGVTCCWNLILPNACPLSGSVCLTASSPPPPPPLRVPSPPPPVRNKPSPPPPPPPPPPRVPSPPPSPTNKPPPPPPLSPRVPSPPPPVKKPPPPPPPPRSPVPPTNNLPPSPPPFPAFNVG